LGYESYLRKVKENKMIKLLVLSAALAFATATGSKPDTSERLKVKIIKMERSTDDKGWWRLNLTFKDEQRLYHAEVSCSIKADAGESSCGHYFLPRVGETYEVINYSDFSVKFEIKDKNSSSPYGITSIEIDACK
jgi:hypothetical protein